MKPGGTFKALPFAARCAIVQFGFAGVVALAWAIRHETGAILSIRLIVLLLFATVTARLKVQLYRAQKRGLQHIDIKASELHRRVGGYPGQSHRMPSCCEAMYAEKRDGDVIIARPPEGKGASLTIRYKLPRRAK